MINGTPQATSWSREKEEESFKIKIDDVVARCHSPEYVHLSLQRPTDRQTKPETRNKKRKWIKEKERMRDERKYPIEFEIEALTSINHVNRRREDGIKKFYRFERESHLGPWWWWWRQRWRHEDLLPSAIQALDVNVSASQEIDRWTSHLDTQKPSHHHG